MSSASTMLLPMLLLALGCLVGAASPKTRPLGSQSAGPDSGEPATKLKKQANCEYERAKWSDCNATGIQQRKLTLIATNSNRNADCEPVKMVTRECQLGCKYARGDWSANCTDGLRVRVDTLLAKVAGKSSPESNFTCQPKRRVTKDCKRACHYLKSAWSECSNGFKLRQLTLDERQPANEKINITATTKANNTFCAKQKIIKRQCNGSDTSKQSKLEPQAKSNSSAQKRTRPKQDKSN